jgi:hypothetical protein
MRFRLSVFACIAFSAAPVLAAATAFVGPSGWSEDTAISSDPTHPTMQWHLPGDPATSLTFSQTTRAYDDALAAIRTNLTTNKIKPSVDKDITCQGKAGHVVEFAAGPDGHKIVINRTLVPTSDGVIAITYTRDDGTGFDPDVKKSLDTFCAGSPS